MTLIDITWFTEEGTATEWRETLPNALEAAHEKRRPGHQAELRLDGHLLVTLDEDGTEFWTSRGRQLWDAETGAAL